MKKLSKPRYPQIPPKFYKEGKHPVAATVDQLRRILEELPGELRIEASFASSVQVIVTNYSYEDVHCRIDGVEDEE